MCVIRAKHALNKTLSEFHPCPVVGVVNVCSRYKIRMYVLGASKMCVCVCVHTHECICLCMCMSACVCSCVSVCVCESKNS
jgi:hypothetical protein